MEETIMIYLDHAATTAAYPEVVSEMTPYLDRQYFNPSGSYREGRLLHKKLDKIREKLAAVIHASPEEIIFTSGGTEADNWVLLNAARTSSCKGRHIITSSIEHHAILHTCGFLEKQGFEVTYLPVTRNGIIDCDMLNDAIRPDTILISIMYANNEIGTLQPVHKIGQIAQKNSIPFHTDAVQAYGHLPIQVDDDSIDFLSVSAHKFGGPKGVGFLYANKELTLTPLLYGGAQEAGRRAGTENVAGIIGMGTASDISTAHQKEHTLLQQTLRDHLMNRILSEIPMTRLNGSRQERLPGNINVSFAGIDSATLIAMLEAKDIYVSGGSACSSSDPSPSHVLKAIGLSDEMALSAVRITIGHENTPEEIEETFRQIKDCVHELRSLA
ncbi:MAG TPA: cysteine desulfurase NifS [Lachnospiraceae bacterium]|nr:cysteine desulfurase NifS [Lachnospiraceae bacterium]